MEILVCGTAAAEGWPALFCECDACQKARALGGKNIRSRAAYMIGDEIRIDFGPDSNLHQFKYGLDYSKLKYLLMTHNHYDHWTPRDLFWRRKGYSKIPTNSVLEIRGNSKIENALHTNLQPDLNTYGINFKEVVPFETIKMGDYEAIPLLGNHAKDQPCFNFLIQSGGKKILFANDTGWYEEETWEFLNDQMIDVVLIDTTMGIRDNQFNHFGGIWTIKARDELLRRKSIKSDAKVFATHFSHNGRALHEELEQYYNPHGIEVAFDGLRITI